MRVRPTILTAIVSSLVVMLVLTNWVEAGRRGSGTVSVGGYYRKDGTYVRPHTRTAPDGNPFNNYSFPGNYNPNTGQITGGDPQKYLERYYQRQGTSSGTMGSPAPVAPPATVTKPLSESPTKPAPQELPPIPMPAAPPTAFRQTAESLPVRSNDFLKGLHRTLKQTGYDPGTPDVQMGDRTKQALQQFQEANQLLTSGEPDIPTLGL